MKIEGGHDEVTGDPSFSCTGGGTTVFCQANYQGLEQGAFPIEVPRGCIFSVYILRAQ